MQRLAYGKEKAAHLIYINTDSLAREALAELEALPLRTPIAIDTEYDEENNTITPMLVSYAWDRSKPRVIKPELFQKYLAHYFNQEDVRVVYQNYKADRDPLILLGMQPDKSFFADIMIMSWLRDETQLRHGLKYQSLIYLRWRRQEYKKLFSYTPAGKKREIVMSPSQVLYNAPPDALAVRSQQAWHDLMIAYSGDDAGSTVALFQDHRDILKSINYWKEYLRVDKPFTETLLRCEERGISLDVPMLQRINRRVGAAV